MKTHHVVIPLWGAAARKRHLKLMAYISAKPITPGKPLAVVVHLENQTPHLHLFIKKTS